MLHIKPIRQQLGLSQTDLAKLTGLSQQYISALERGLRPSLTEHVSRIATALGVTEDVIFNGSPRRRTARLKAVHV